MLRTAIAAAVSLLIAAPVAAQDSPILALDPTAMVGHAGTIAAGQHLQQSLKTPLNRARPGAAAAPAARIARLDYRSNAKVRQKVYARAVAQMAKTSPAEAAKLRALLNGGGVRSEVATYLRRYGMSADNVADTTALYLAQAWFAAHANSGDPTHAQLRGIRAQVASVMTSTTGLTGASDALKQEVAEAAIIQASMMSMLANTAARDPKFAAVARKSVRQGVMDIYHFDITQARLTDQGLR